MPACKATMFFESGNAGWTESWYTDADGPGSAMTRLETLAGYRQIILAGSVRLSFLRTAMVDQPNLALLREKEEGINKLDVQDVPWTGILARISTLNNHRRMICLRGIDDAMVTGRSFVPSQNFQTGFAQLVQRLTLDQWQLRVTGPGGVAPTVVAVDGAGKCTTAIPHGLANGDRVRFLRSHYGTGSLVKGTFSNIAVVDGFNFTMPTWPLGSTAIGGRVRKYGVSYDNVKEGIYLRASERRVGRPFGSPRGRRKRSV